MAYIGNQPASAFASTEKQTITGNGTTGPYALTHEVAAATDIACFVNNVRQEPGVAYTVSGNQMTMTGNVASTDDFYVVYIGRVVGTVNHPANAPLPPLARSVRLDLQPQVTSHQHAANECRELVYRQRADEFVIGTTVRLITILSANNDSGFILFGDDSDRRSNIRKR